MSNARIDSLKDHMPEVLLPHDVLQDWDDHFDVIPLDDPEEVGDKIFVSHREEMQDGVLTANGLEIEAGGLLESEDIHPELPDIIGEIFAGSHGGAPTPLVDKTKSPPPDCLAFYLPFHYYYPEWWGVYLLYDGVVWLAREIQKLSKGMISGVSAVQAARLFLYYHEAFHHKTECFATRLEITHRKPLYKTAFEQNYQNMVGKDECLEEALANAEALKKVLSKFPAYSELKSAFEAYILDSPPGYNKGVDVAYEFEPTKNQFAEENQRNCDPALHHKSPDIWSLATHMFDGISNIKGRVNYILPRGSRLANRLRFKPLLPPNKLVKKLREMVGLELVRHGGNHDVYRSAAGKQTAIPRHPKDITTGTLRSILRELGIPGGLEQFQRS
jgi:predicted RNA binding protein YcfA (HicA-like mRNA interferase family)